MSSNKRQKSEEEVVVVYTQGVDVPKNVTKVIFDASVTEIPANAFECCKQLKEVVLNEGLQRIGYWAFRGCRSLAIIKLPSTVTEVGTGAFRDCTNLREVVLNEGLRIIDFEAFALCTSFTTIKLPSTLTEVGSFAFNYCSNLKEVALNECLQKIPNNAFAGCASSPVFKIPSISKRAKNLIEAGQTDIEDKVTVSHHFEWRGGELLASPQAIRYGNWVAVRTHLEQVLAWISHYELKDATSLFELALWKSRISEKGAATDEERSACRVDVPGPAKETILQYLQHREQ